jgi:hypothetical protein
MFGLLASFCIFDHASWSRFMVTILVVLKGVDCT